MKRYTPLLIAFIFLVGMSHAVLAQTQSGDKETPDNTHKESLDRKPPPFRIGVKWYYGEEEVVDNGLRKGVRIFEIEDTITWKGKKAFVVRPGMDGSDYDVDYMWVDEERHKVYFWNYEKEAYELNYDFNNDSFYYIEYVREDTAWVETQYRVDIDSVDTIEINGRYFRRQIIRSQAIIDAYDIIENIGSIQRTGPRMQIGTIYDSPFLYLTKLRCFENEELYKFVDFPCDSTWLTNPNDPPKLQFGATWYYEEHDKTNQRVGARVYSLGDARIWKGKFAYVLQPPLDGTGKLDYMWVDELKGKVYFWNYEKEAYELNYDFNNDSFYYIEYVAKDTSWVDSSLRIDIVSVDTIELKGRYFRRQFVRIDALPDVHEIIENIGAMQNTGPRLPFGLKYDSPNLFLTNLRCYKNGQLYKFVDFPCDTVWLTSTKEIWIAKAGVYPNPHQGRVYFKEVPKGTRYRLYGVGGRLLEEGVLYREYLDVPHSGVTILELHRKDGAVLRKKLVGITASD